MDRTTGAVDLRRHLRDELQDLLTAVRPDQLNLIELNDMLAILRPAATRVRERRPRQ